MDADGKYGDGHVILMLSRVCCFYSSDSQPASVNVFSVLIAQLLPPAPSVPTLLTMAPGLRLKSIQVTQADATTLVEDKETYVYSVAVTDGKRTYNTPWANECRWEVDYPIEPSDTVHAVSLELYRKRKKLQRLPCSRKLGKASFDTQMIEDTEEVGEAKGPETSSSANSDPSGTLGAPPNVALPDIPKKLLDNAETLGGVLQLIQPFKEVFDNIAEVHPVAKGAWLVVSGAYQVLKNQHDRDGQLVDLYNLMMKTYEIATENDLYQQDGDKKLCAVIDAMVKHSKECSIFISNYGSRGYLYRILTGSEASTRIQDYRVSFSDLQKAFTSDQIDLTTREF
ncbi:hypothetical protein D9758_003476 [Tetrapyrgos nigripes]|uniref:Uncharacterized protein n=1 Tax=Tetrapyrgos nigripes TaxID=182062 RepID=A0A8H5LVI8_9AGAR|nr:hypothetical protein D9758_003476 [Tetrapyrgos nigripes]